MKHEIRMALLGMAALAAPVFAQNALPQCGANNFDPTQKIFTVIGPRSGAVNEQCTLTVYAKGKDPSQAAKSPASYIVEGTYTIELSGGGGGGGGGASNDQGGGGGGAGAAPSRTVKYLSPGVYKLTIGTGGQGGRPDGGRVGSGNPTSLSDIRTGQLIAGFAGADVWSQHSDKTRGDGKGGAASVGGSRGGSGGDSAARPEIEAAARAGGVSQTKGYAGVPGQSGNERYHVDATTVAVVQANAGGGGGAGAGDGGAGASANTYSVAASGELGGGGGGGKGGLNKGDAGARGGHGFIRLTLLK